MPSPFKSWPIKTEGLRVWAHSTNQIMCIANKLECIPKLHTSLQPRHQLTKELNPLCHSWKATPRRSLRAWHISANTNQTRNRLVKVDFRVWRFPDLSELRPRRLECDIGNAIYQEKKPSVKDLLKLALSCGLRQHGELTKESKSVDKTKRCCLASRGPFALHYTYNI